MSATQSPPAILGPPAENPPHEPISEWGRWMALTAALLGWMFDGAEMGLFSLVGAPAVRDLLSVGGTVVPLQADVDRYFGIVIAVFLVGAASGGVLFGWLGDRIGRVRAMALSVLVYAIFTGLCGFAGEAWQIVLLRFIAALGMGGEWALGVSLVMEVWPNRSRAFMAGLIGAAANVGYLLVGFVGMGLNSVLSDVEAWLLAINMPAATVEMLVRNQGWRIMMMLGATPALLTVFFRLFVPESHKWEAEDQKGTTSHWATIDLLGVLVGAAGTGLIIAVFAWDVSAAWHWTLQMLVTLVGLAIATVGYTYPVFRFLQRSEAQTGKDEIGQTFFRMMLGAGLAGVALLGTWGAVQWAPKWAIQLTAGQEGIDAKEWTLVLTSVGAILGTILAALTGDWLGRRWTYFFLCVLSLLSSWGLYQLNDSYGPSFLIWVFLQGLFTASFYGWLPLYLPELFGTNVRATGQGFAFNFGRILAAIGALNTGALVAFFQSVSPEAAFPTAASWMCLIYVVGMVLIWFAPETYGKPLPE